MPVSAFLMAEVGEVAVPAIDKHNKSNQGE
jgi:hypothetical protein